MADLRKLKDKAAEAGAKGKLDKAARLYREALDGDPKDVATLQKLADVLRRGGHTDEAIETYREVADRFGRDGLLIKAIAISKTILELDPDHVETQSALAELYARKAAAEKSRPPVRGTLMMAAVTAPAGEGGPRGAVAPPTPPPPTDDDVVAIPLRAAAPSGPVVPPPLPIDDISLAVSGVASCGEQGPAGDDVSLDIVVEEAPPQASPASPPSATALEEIVAAAGAALEEGIDEQITFEPEPIDVPGASESLDPYVPPPESNAHVPQHVAAPEAPAEPSWEEPPPAPSLDAPAAAPHRPPATTQQPQGLPALSPEPSPPPVAISASPEQPAAELPRFPIFSDLSPEAFVALARGMVLLRASPGDVVISEGETGTSFFVVATGRLAVTRRDELGAQMTLGRLGEGDFFGEMALLSGTPRSATVTAEEECEVLELRADVLAEIARHHPHLAGSLRRFYRQRLLANAMAVSPIFRPVARGDRKLIMARFRARDVQAGEVVIREGEPSDGLYVVLEGAVDVVKRAAGGGTPVARLREGDVFGEMSCLRKAPASASVVVARAGTLLRLPRQDFDWLVVTYPQVLEHVSDLSEERMENLDAILSGRAQWTDEGLVLV